MSQENIGNQINQLLHDALRALFRQGENVQLTYSAYETQIKSINHENLEQYTLTYPVGYNADKTSMLGSAIYKKDELIQQYTFLSNNQLGINGVYQLVIIIEAVLSDLLRKVILKYPHKIGSKRSIKSSLILSATSIEELHIKTTDSILNELAYKSPKEFSECCKDLLSINLLECPAFHKYIEVKSTRDIYIHNLGIVNDLYINKTGSHARGKLGERLPVTSQYFLESYEECLTLIEWLEVQAHTSWHSSEYEDREAAKKDKETTVDEDEAVAVDVEVDEAVDVDVDEVPYPTS